MVDYKYIWGAWMIVCTLALNMPVMDWANGLTSQGLFLGPLPFNHAWVLAWVLVTMVGLFGMWQTIGKRGDRQLEENIQGVIEDYGHRRETEGGEAP